MKFIISSKNQSTNVATSVAAPEPTRAPIYCNLERNPAYNPSDDQKYLKHSGNYSVIVEIINYNIAEVFQKFEQRNAENTDFVGVL